VSCVHEERTHGILWTGEFMDPQSRFFWASRVAQLLLSEWLIGDLYTLNENLLIRFQLLIPWPN
jgi:hypothetical protein